MEYAGEVLRHLPEDYVPEMVPEGIDEFTDPVIFL
jgi:hypothetical protein